MADLLIIYAVTIFNIFVAALSVYARTRSNEMLRNANDLYKEIIAHQDKQIRKLTIEIMEKKDNGS